MIDDDLSGLPRSALRDYDDDPRLDRVWSRLESELDNRPARTRVGWLLAPAFGVAMFVAGVLVGRNVVPPVTAPLEFVAERPSPSEPSRSVALPAGTSEHRATSPAPTSRPKPSSQRIAVPPPVAVEPELGSDREAIARAPLLPAGPPEWQKLAEVGDFEAARAALDREGGFDVALSHASPDQLLGLVDVARASGSRDRAIRALRRLLDSFPGAPEAPLAAWTLGNILEQGGDSARAAEAFALYRRLSPAGDFAEDAAARQVHVALAQGNVELAVELLDQYAKDFPNGRRLPEFREELGKLQLSAADGSIAEDIAEPPPAPPEPLAEPR